MGEGVFGKGSEGINLRHFAICHLTVALRIF